VLSSNLGVWAQRLYQSTPAPTHQAQTNDLVPKCDILFRGLRQLLHLARQSMSLLVHQKAL
jgi:hypothetical protein